MKPSKANLSLGVLLIVSFTFSACLSFKPATNTSRHYVLTPAPAAVARAPGGSKGLRVGLGRIEIPEYLQPKQIALRRGHSEIQYSETDHWAERLDKGIQRVLGANIASLLGATNMVLSAWRRTEVQAEVYISVRRFESDELGHVVLEAQWRINHPGAEEIWHSDFSRIIKQGPAPAKDPDGAVAALSEALACLSREIAAKLSGLWHACGGNAE